MFLLEQWKTGKFMQESRPQWGVLSFRAHFPGLPLWVWIIAAVAGEISQPAFAGEMWASEELARFPAAEADQGVAVDGDFFYAIRGREIGKYLKKDGRRVGGWKADSDRFGHLNAGVVRDGKLYAAHSNFPHLPMTSSVEIWDTETMQHIGSQSFGIEYGSLTWIDRRDGSWYACFANYAKMGGESGRGVEWSQIVRYDDQWRRTGGWVFPSALVEKFEGFSCSCGGFGPGGKLFVTGHNAKEFYVLEFPEAGSVMKWVGTVPVENEGQAFAWDPVSPGVEYGIVRRTKDVVVCRVWQELSTAK